MKITSKKAKRKYNPNLGFIGNTEVQVSNYLFSKKRLRQAYIHAKPVADRILNNEISSHYQESKRLTKFLKLRDLTFSKKTNKGYKTFVVPCTTTVVPLQKSLFNEVELASQKLMISLRAVLQDIYGSKDIASSKFVQSLPKEVKEVFIESVSNCPTYLPQLHHESMKNYPFLDNVGLDLVLVEDYLQKSSEFPALIAKKDEDALPNLPFRILEINAGSPSGASNNMNMLEGIYNQNPEILNGLGKLMPNDHFEILGETYKSLGKEWTGIEDGIQVVLPPGGQNGAAPEIHQLAAYSGLIYADPDQLYQDDQGYIRLRTVKENPIVTAIYSRVNTDSALFDTQKGLLLRDQDTGEKLYLRDALKLGKDGKSPFIRDSKGKKIPLQSAFAIPGAIEAITSGKLYMGGLNRIMDNKIILATLTHYAPKFFAEDIESNGLSATGTKILPPQTLPPKKESVDIIKSNPDEWVVKAPSLAGGQGVYILKTLNANRRKEVLEMITKNPKDFAYQQLVKIARIPVAVQRKETGYKFANLAADIRMWIFYGAGEGVLPKITHNALVRYAPQEKGAMSSIVNTSAGGGYAPFVIIDDTNDKNAVSAKELVKPKETISHTIAMPLFVAAGLVQISRMLKEANLLLAKDSCSTNQLLGLVIGIKLQLKEVLSFLNPRGIESIYKIIHILEAKTQKNDVARYFTKIRNNQLEVVEILKVLESKLSRDTLDNLQNIRALSIETVNNQYTVEEKALDYVILNDIKKSEKLKLLKDKKLFNKLIQSISQSIELECPDSELSVRSKRSITALLEEFCDSSKERLIKSAQNQEFAKLFDLNSDVTRLKFETLYLGDKDQDKEIKVSTQLEMRKNILLADSAYIPAHLQTARQEWLQIKKEAKKLNSKAKASFISSKRIEHFNKFPFLQRYQSLLNKIEPTTEEIIELLPIAPYAKFNIENFAKDQGLSVSEVFSSSLKPNRLSLLSERQLAINKLRGREYAGECFAKKKQSHGLYSDSDVFIWLRKGLNAFTTIYTAGHEIIHYRQLKNSMEAEERALKDGGVSIAKFINYYGNFLGANQRTVDAINFDMQPDRVNLYGYTDRSIIDFNNKIITDLRNALNESTQKWDDTVKSYGSLFGYMMPNSPGTRVKALQEVLPALENAKNISFAKELGLEIDICEVKSALPAANKNQVKQNMTLIKRALKSAQINWEALRVIANHQYYGVSFNRADIESKNLTLTPQASTVQVGNSYNQTQQ